MSLRILYVDNEHSWRGGQQQLFDLMTGLSGQGLDIRLAAPPDAPLSRRAEAVGIRTVALSQRVELSPAATARLQRLIRQEGCRLVHCNTPRGILAAGLAARRANAVVVASRRVVFPLRGRLSALKYNRLVDCTATVADCIRRRLVDDGVDPERIEVIYEGVDLAELDAQQPAELSLPGEGPVVGTVAAMTPEKGHDTLLEAAAALKESGPRLRLVLVGDGPRRAHLEEKCSRLGLADSVHFLGFRNDVSSLLKKLDIFCLPSLSEGLSSAILEAMGCGLPVVASRVGGTPELVLDGETGLLATAGNPAELGEALADLAASGKRRLSLGNAGRSRVEKHFTRSRKLKLTEELYRRLLAASGIR